MLLKAGLQNNARLEPVRGAKLIADPWLSLPYWASEVSTNTV